MHLASLVTFVCATLLYRVSAECYTPQPLNRALADLGLQSYASDAQSSQSWNQCTSCEVACGLLTIVLKSAVSNSSSTNYSSQSSNYWAQQQSSITPACYVLAQDADAVSAVITVARLTLCPFAVRSGGHSDIPGASNIQGGVTVDLGQLNSVQVSSDHKITQVGPGANWGNVYRQLDPMGLTVIGGRESSVGVGGLTLGGGMSFYSGMYGFACDNVAMYEVVMADGLIANITHKSNPDLYFALRGGANNFGIVTKFYLDTYPQGLMWGGIRVYPISANATINKAFETFNNNANTDTSAALITSFSYHQGNFFSSCVFDYAKPQADPPIFHDFLALANETYVDTTRITTLHNLTDELDASTPPGFRNRYTTATFKNSAALQSQMIDIYISELKAVVGSITNTTGFAPVIAFQPISTAISKHFAKNGGNALGVSPTDGPLMLIQFNWAWASAADDTRVIGAIENILHRSTAAAQAMGLLNDYIYLNYAAPDQQPFAGYGPKNLQRLQQIQRNYDPEGVFEVLQPGYFKLNSGRSSQ